MSDFMHDLVGVKFQEGGLTPETGFYCYGLIRWVIGQGTGVWLPERPIGWKPHVTVVPFSGACLRYDVLMFSQESAGLIDHVGVCDGAGDFIHCNSKSSGVVREPVSRHSRRIISVARLRRED